MTASARQLPHSLEAEDALDQQKNRTHYQRRLAAQEG